MKNVNGLSLTFRMHLATYYGVGRSAYPDFYRRLNPAEILPYGAGVYYLIRKNQLADSQDLMSGLKCGYLNGNIKVLK